MKFEPIRSFCQEGVGIGQLRFTTQPSPSLLPLQLHAVLLQSPQLPPLGLFRLCRSTLQKVSWKHQRFVPEREIWRGVNSINLTGIPPTYRVTPRIIGTWPGSRILSNTSRSKQGFLRVEQEQKITCTRCHCMLCLHQMPKQVSGESLNMVSEKIQGYWRVPEPTFQS